MNITSAFIVPSWPTYGGYQGNRVDSQRCKHRPSRAGGAGPKRRGAEIHMKRKLDGSGREYITLESFIKVQGVTDTGGQAKMLISDGDVEVNDEVETRRGRKLHDGDTVAVTGGESMVVAFDNGEDEREEVIGGSNNENSESQI